MNEYKSTDQDGAKYCRPCGLVQTALCWARHRQVSINDARQDPDFLRLHPNRAHNAGFLAFEAVVSYPFHPLVGQTVVVIGDYEHDGIRYFLIRQPSGGSYQIPDWMFDPIANDLAIVSILRLPVSQLMLLRALIDRLVASPSKES